MTSNNTARRTWFSLSRHAFVCTFAMRSCSRETMARDMISETNLTTRARSSFKVSVEIAEPID